MPIVVKRDELPRTKHAHEFVGADHGEVPVSLIFVHAAPAAGPKLHRYPDAEVFVVESGQATFEVGDDSIVAVGRPDRSRTSGSLADSSIAARVSCV